MTDRELFQKTVKRLPSLVLPLLGTLLAGYLLRDGLPRMAAGLLFLGAEKAGHLDLEGLGTLLALLPVCLLGFLGAVAAALLSLGAYRLCLDRGEGRPGTMPWTLLREARRYRGWALWMGVVPIFWKVGRLILRLWLGNRLDDMAFARFNQGMSYYNAALNVASLLLFSLLALSVRTAYLRAPERGFWRAVGFGLGEGLRKWPRTIRAQLKFVVPVHVGQGVASILLHRLAFQVGGPGISALCGGAGQVLSWMSTIWILTFYGQLAADRYDYPEKKEEVETL